MKKLIIPSIALGAVIVAVIATNLSAESKQEGGHGHDAGHDKTLDAGHDEGHGEAHDEGHGEAHWASPKEAAARVNPVKSDQASLDRGKQVFMTNCASCHGATAKGDGPVGLHLNPKPTDLTIMAGNHQDGDFEWKIANGRGAMPAWKTILNDNQRWDVVNYIQALENPNGKGNMAGMDHSNMTKEEMEAMMGKGVSSDSVKDDQHKAENSHNDKAHGH